MLNEEKKFFAANWLKQSIVGLWDSGKGKYTALSILCITRNAAYKNDSTINFFVS
jgi:hypothetical protein